MKKLVLIFLAAISLCSCEKERDKIIGSWVYQSADVSFLVGDTLKVDKTHITLSGVAPLPYTYTNNIITYYTGEYYNIEVIMLDGGSKMRLEDIDGINAFSGTLEKQ